MIVTNKQYEKEEEDFRAKKKKVSFAGASEEIRMRVEARLEVDKSNREAAEEAQKKDRDYVQKLEADEPTGRFGGQTWKQQPGNAGFFCVRCAG